jgi:hypothetical protein
MSRLHGSIRQSRLHVGPRAWRALPALLALATLAACAGVNVTPMPGLPRALVQPMQARVGLVLDEELRRYLHEETRSGSSWKVALGPGHEELFTRILGETFGAVTVFQNPDDARAASGLQAVFRPRIEQYSFATAEETGGQYWAVTLRYRITITGQGGQEVDVLTLTGYGSHRGGGSSGALGEATRAAMRDAAAKFLVQMPRQPLGQKLAGGAVLTSADAEAAQVDVVEVVPIEAAP